jgi:CheY-like chemotaxis protein
MSETFKLLVIDDEAEALVVMKKLIESFGGYKVYTAETVDEAITLLPNAQGILADVNLPGKERLNKILAHSEIPVARFSGATQEVFNFMLQKPYTKADLKKTLDWIKSLAANNEELESFLAQEFKQERAA